MYVCPQARQCVRHSTLAEGEMSYSNKELASIYGSDSVSESRQPQVHVIMAAIKAPMINSAIFFMKLLSAQSEEDIQHMNMRIMDSEEYEASKKLWLECFDDDSREFTDWYYSARTKPDYALGFFLDGCKTPIAMLHMLPMNMRFGKRAESICFVSGVCTKPEYRGRGICGKLFEKAFDIMKNRGFAATVLQPFDTAFYERFGYRVFIKQKSIKLSVDRLNKLVRTHDDSFGTPDIPKADFLVKLYNESMRGYSGYSIRDREYFIGFIDEYSMKDAELVISPNGCCAGYAEGADGKTFHATELFFMPSSDYASLLPKGYEEYIFPLPVCFKGGFDSDANIEDFSMIRPINEDFCFADASLYGFDRY